MSGCEDAQPPPSISQFTSHYMNFFRMIWSKFLKTNFYFSYICIYLILICLLISDCFLPDSNTFSTCEYVRFDKVCDLGARP